VSTELTGRLVPSDQTDLAEAIVVKVTQRRKRLRLREVALPDIPVHRAAPDEILFSGEYV